MWPSIYASRLVGKSGDPDTKMGLSKGRDVQTHGLDVLVLHPVRALDLVLSLDISLGHLVLVHF